MQANGFAQAPHEGQLDGEFIRHFGAVRFIFFEEFVAKSGFAGIENDAHIIGLIIFQYSPQNIVEQKWNSGGDAGAGVHAHHRRKESPVDMGHGVD